jgi:hypothetical protein
MMENSEDAADCLRLWYILYICDQHLATLYGRPSIVQEDFSLQGSERFLDCTVATDQDHRLVSQVQLLLIFRKIRELFGPDTGKPLPQVYLNQIANFNRQLDQWVGHWSSTLKGCATLSISTPANVVLHDILTNPAQKNGTVSRASRARAPSCTSTSPGCTCVHTSSAAYATTRFPHTSATAQPWPSRRLSPSST